MSDNHLQNAGFCEFFASNTKKTSCNPLCLTLGFPAYIQHKGFRRALFDPFAPCDAAPFAPSFSERHYVAVIQR
jgi:hypothetical protein